MNDQSNTNPRQALAEAIRQSTNILVTVSNNPTIDQLAACLGLTIWLNKLDKHATAVFSGDVPSTLEFLEPEATLEKDTDSLRDFIIALDKSKADKLRYKVEENVVKIFITPYRTSLSADDLEYSQGDYNVDMVIALGVHEQADLDVAVVAHGRILHDATVSTLTVGDRSSDLGSITWHVDSASGLSELVTELGTELGANELDAQIATALLTGVVSETERFSNEKTTPQVMSISAQLMAAGANQQLVAAKLTAPAPEPQPEPEIVSEPEAASEVQGPVPETAETEERPPTEDDGTLRIDHDGDEVPDEQVADEDASADVSEAQPAEEHDSQEDIESKFATEPPSFGGTLTANAAPEDVTAEPSSDPLSTKPDEASQPLLSHDNDGDSNASQSEESSDGVAAEVSSDNNDNVEPDVALPATQNSTDDAAQMQPAPPNWMPPQPWMDGKGDPTTDESKVEDTPQQPTNATDSVSANETPASEPTEQPIFPTTEPTPATPPSADTIADLEQEVESAHLNQSTVDETVVNAGDDSNPEIDNARNEVMRAINSTPDANPEPVAALNAQPIDLSPQEDSASKQETAMAFDPVAFEASDYKEPIENQAPQPAPGLQSTVDVDAPVEQPFTMPLPGSPLMRPANPVPPTSNTNDPTAPPPVPPPMTGFPPQQ